MCCPVQDAALHSEYYNATADLDSLAVQVRHEGESAGRNGAQAEHRRTGHAHLFAWPLPS